MEAKMKTVFYATASVFFVVLTFCVCFATSAYRNSVADKPKATIDLERIIKVEVPIENSYDAALWFWQLEESLREAKYDARVGKDAELNKRPKNQENND